MLYVILEKAINHLLKLDPDTLNRLNKLQGRVVKVTVTDWQMDCYILIQEQGVRLTGDWPGLVDTTISGKLAGLIRVGYSGASGPALFDQGIEITGDMDLGETIRDILRRTDIDGEEFLSRFLGDAAAHEITWRAKQVVDFGLQTCRGIGENIREFCQNEAQYLPTRTQAENLYQQIARLREDVDRASALLSRLENKIAGGKRQ
jgi:ubiquinone biosynthesis accessory factor UbiJ